MLQISLVDHLLRAWTRKTKFTRARPSQLGGRKPSHVTHQLESICNIYMQTRAKIAAAITSRRCKSVITERNYLHATHLVIFAPPKVVQPSKACVHVVMKEGLDDIVRRVVAVVMYALSARRCLPNRPKVHVHYASRTTASFLLEQRVLLFGRLRFTVRVVQSLRLLGFLLTTDTGINLARLI